VFEKPQQPVLYPTYYEASSAPRTSSTPARSEPAALQLIPWIIKTLGKKKFFIVGSNYIYPREMAGVEDLIEKNGGEWIADEYLELGHSEWARCEQIKTSGCDVVLSNVVGDSVYAFYANSRTRA